MHYRDFPKRHINKEGIAEMTILMNHVKKTPAIDVHKTKKFLFGIRESFSRGKDVSESPNKIPPTNRKRIKNYTDKLTRRAGQSPGNKREKLDKYGFPTTYIGKSASQQRGLFTKAYKKAKRRLTEFQPPMKRTPKKK